MQLNGLQIEILHCRLSTAVVAIEATVNEQALATG